MKRASAAVLIISSLAVISAVRAQSPSGMLGRFQSPSGNIFCEVNRDEWSGKTTVSLSCEVNKSTAKLPPKPSDCGLEWGKLFYVEARGKAIRYCGNDVLFNPTLPVLPYGEVWQVGGFRCDATTVRVRCVNLDKHGFELSRARQIGRAHV